MNSVHSSLVNSLGEPGRQYMLACKPNEWNALSDPCNLVLREDTATTPSNTRGTIPPLHKYACNTPSIVIKYYGTFMIIIIF